MLGVPTLNPEAADIDSLWDKLERLPADVLIRLFGPAASDTTQTSRRLDLQAMLTRAQEQDARGERKEAVALLEQAYHTARSHGLKKEALVATLNLGFATLGMHDLKAAERRLSEAEKLIKDFSGTRHYIQYCRLRAMVLSNRRKYSAAEKVLQKAIRFSDAGDQDVKQDGLLARASYIHLLCDQKRVSEADDYVALAREVLGASGRHLDVAFLAELVVACIHWAISKADAPQLSAFIQLALEIGSGQQAATCLSYALQDCANGARGMRNFDAALACASAAEHLGHIAQRPVLAFIAAYTAAAVLAETEDFHAVRERCLGLLDAARTLPEPKLRFCVFHLLSLASRQLGDKTTAVDAAETALRDSEGDSTCLCMSKMALAEALLDCGRAREAMEQARIALLNSEHADVPPEWVDQALAVLADCCARLGDWASAESYAGQLRERSSPHSASRREMVANRIRMHKRIRSSLSSVVDATAPLSLARTEGAGSVQAANAILLQGVLDGWKEYPNAASAIYDYWGRGNLVRAMLNMRAFPNAFNMTLEVHTVQEARRAIRLWGLIADVLVLIWKGPTVSSGVMCPVPLSFSTAGGGGYLLTFVKAPPPVASDVTGLAVWKTMSGADVATPAIVTPYASLLPPDVGRFLCEEAVHLIALGRLIVVPATGIGCVARGHGPVENLFAEACNAIPAIRGDAARFPAWWLPYFPDIPLSALAEVVQEYDVSLCRLRLVLIRKAREFRRSPLTGTEAKELELEIHDSLAHLTDIQSRLRGKHGWGNEQEAVATRYDGFSDQAFAPILVLQSMGYRWRVEQTFVEPISETLMVPRKDEPLLTWLAQPDAHPKFVTRDDTRDSKRKGR